MIYVSTVDIRGDLTSTMPITVFLAAFEPNLAVLCASIPMLRPCYTRYRQRYASRYSENSSGAYSSGKKSANSLSNNRRRGNSVELDTVHMLEHDLHKSGGYVGSHHEECQTLDGTQSERNMTHPDALSTPKIVVDKP